MSLTSERWAGACRVLKGDYIPGGVGHVSYAAGACRVLKGDYELIN